MESFHRERTAAFQVFCKSPCRLLCQERFGQTVRMVVVLDGVGTSDFARTGTDHASEPGFLSRATLLGSSLPRIVGQAPGDVKEPRLKSVKLEEVMVEVCQGRVTDRVHRGNGEPKLLAHGWDDAVVP